MTHFPADWDATPALSSPAARQEEWKALEAIYHAGEARSIGVSHYCPNHIDDVLEVATVRPSVNQVEYHIGSGDVDGVIDKCKEEGIHFMSFSALCGPCDVTPEDNLISGQLVTAIGAKCRARVERIPRRASREALSRYNVSGSQVSLRFVVQQALENPTYWGGVIPKSDNADHIAEDLDIFSFELSDDDMATLAAATLPAGTGGDCDVP